ncbi:MAG: type II toxin-antitoxin system RelE/ParE family toxin [Thiomonas arsenitoxydans]|jgi:plasmid stabilization system protein ParE|nr:type II toxin-antitoxin system RelE/ParE family toxin [Thiomonas arsenitoxydans]
MSSVRFAPAALRDLRRLQDFLASKDMGAAQRAGQVIEKGLRVLAEHPQIGRPVEDMEESFRAWPIPFGDSGYLALYRVDTDAVTILAIRHQKESGWA